MIRVKPRRNRRHRMNRRRTPMEKMMGRPKQDARLPSVALDGLAHRWMCQWGEGEYFLFCSFALDGVEHHLRWLPPGSYDVDGDELVLNEGLWVSSVGVEDETWRYISMISAFRSKVLSELELRLAVLLVGIEHDPEKPVWYGIHDSAH